MDLFRLALPDGPEGSEELYIRVTDGTAAVDGGKIILYGGSRITTDTYFNAFSSSKYAEYTNAKDITYRCEVSGKADVLLHRCTRDSDAVVGSASVDSADPKEVTFDFNIDGLSDRDEVTMHYVEFAAFGDSMIHSIGRYTSDIEPDDVDLAVVICTFNREEYVRNTLKRIEHLFADETYNFGNTSIYVVDNGQTLTDDICTAPAIRLFPNRNLGGSGGFARGMIEAKESGKSHVILMDDDVVIDPNIVYKTLNMIRILKPKFADAFVLGGMISQDNPTMQYEAGSRYNGNFKGLKKDLDLSRKESLFKNDLFEKTDYGAWWFISIPLNCDDYLPMPFFIKMDDVEYGFRNSKDNIVMNGIGIWHEDFIKKRNRVAERYYHERNALMTAAIHGIKDRQRPFRYWYEFFQNVACIDYRSISMINMAYTDYLSGVDAFLETDTEKLHGRLMDANKTAETYPSPKKVISIFTELFKRRFWISVRECLRMNMKYERNKKTVSTEFRERCKELTDESEWKRRLGL